ncbi:hypothetical protein NLG97_g1792 [Lecanicillium saksenae]|uniref:Uncharacterized protein n=1 Tax=Lecanicillium saksenae TaxID=468837 RepID=A0ACC1R4M5_9HYPO|nr:hypothetical protein NLG97_g1792 [Lecanicillium saksenae]
MLSDHNRRISQRAPKACQECTRRKVRCDKTVPCSRCRRLKKACTREDVLTTKAAAQGNGRGDEAAFLRRLQDVLGNNSAEDAQTLVTKRLSEVAHSIVNCAPEDKHRAASPEAASSPSLAVRTLESQIWSRQSTSCYPHRSGCSCPHHRSYTELVSINCDMSSPMIQWASVFVDPALYLPTADARKVVQFHISYLWWHHNALHAPTFLSQCNIFWSTGQVTHRIWLSLYLSVISSTLWTLLNSPLHRQRLGVDFSEDIIAQQFRELLRVFYAEDFLSNPSMCSIQAIVIATRFAHNIGFSDSVTNLLVSAVGLAQSMGLHRIDGSAADDQELGVASYKQIELENESYSDDDLVSQSEDTITSSSYTRCIAAECLLMPEVFDGFLGSENDHRRIYQHISDMGKRMKSLISSFPKQFLGSCHASADMGLVWLPTARRTLAISVSDKIIMLHRPLLLQAFRTSAFPDVKQTCLSAALTIFREHENTALGTHEILSIWTQSAFCTTATVVLGLELLYGEVGAGSRHEDYLATLKNASERLQTRRCDTMATKCSKLIWALIGAHDELAVSEQLTSANDRTRMADCLIHDQRLLSQVLSVAAPETGPSSDTAPEDWAYSDVYQQGYAFDFDVWYNQIFTNLA